MEGIKSTDCRVGNIFEYNGQTVYMLNVLSNGKSDFGYFKDSIGFLRNYSDKDCPTMIPLTEDWLIKFGFKHSASYYDCKIYGNKSNYFVSEVRGTFKLVLKETDDSPWIILCEIKYVHEVQNNFYNLTNAELTLSNNKG